MTKENSSTVKHDEAGILLRIRHHSFFTQEPLIPESRNHPSGNPIIGRLPDQIALLAACLLLGLFLWKHGAGPSLIPVLAITIAFAVIGRLARGVNTSGMLAGALIAFIIAGRELKAFWVLLVVFLLTLVATRAGRSRKQQLRVAEPGSGRSASQVAANLGIAALCLALPAFNGFILLALSALAEAAADTVSSESGSAFPGKTVLITTWQPVSPGTDGGISLTGTLSGAVAALIVAGSSYAFGLIPASGVAVVASAGVAGMLVDSALGATFERPGLLNNDLVNLLGTIAAAGAAWLAN